MVAVEAGLAEVLVIDVGQAVLDVDQADVSVDGESGQVIMASDAETEAVVLQTVTDAAWDASRPVLGLSVAIGAAGAQVGAWDVGEAVGNLWQARTHDWHG